MKTYLTAFFILFLTACLVSCSPKPYSETNKFHRKKLKEILKNITENNTFVLTDSLNKSIPVDWVGTVNFSLRKPDFIIIHHTAQDSLSQTLKTFTIEKTQVSAHYVIGRNGEIVHMLNDYLRAHHAGVGKWGANQDLNSSSIGIELDNNGNEPFADDQINSLIALLTKLKADYKIPTANFIGHADIAPSRKPDPNINFPWQKLADKGFGYWYHLPDLPPPADFDTETALKRIGYDTKNLDAAIVAFKRHFVKLDLDPVLSEWDKCVLFNLYKKY